MIEITQNNPTSKTKEMQTDTPDQAPPSLDSLYQKLNEQLLSSSFAATAAEAHGLISGLVCRDLSRAELESKANLFGFTDQSNALFWSLLEMVDRDLRQSDFNFNLWLPETESLNERTEALGHWAHGYVLGLSHDGDTVVKKLQQELQEAFDDLVAISGAISESDDKEDEVAFIEISEYVRITTQLIFEELNPVAPIVEEAI